MFTTKALSAASLAAISYAQTATVANYTAATPTITQGTGADKIDLITSSFGVVYEEVISGADSNTLIKEVFKMTMNEDSPFPYKSTTYSEQIVCNANTGTTTF